MLGRNSNVVQLRCQQLVLGKELGEVASARCELADLPHEVEEDALLLWHEHLDKKLLGGKLLKLMRMAIDGKKKYEEAMKAT